MNREGLRETIFYSGKTEFLSLLLLNQQFSLLLPGGSKPAAHLA